MLIDKLPEDAEEVLNEVEFLRQKLMEDPSDDVCRKLIAAEDRLINKIPTNYTHHGNLVIDYGVDLALVWKITREEEVWQHGLSQVLRWCELTINDWRNPVYVLAHGIMLYGKAQTTSEMSDINNAITVLKQAVESVKESFVAQKGSLPLADLFLIRFERNEDLADLEAALAYSWLKVSKGNVTDPDRFFALNTFVRSLLKRYELKSEISDLKEAITSATYAIGIAPETYYRGDMEMLLGSALRFLYTLSKSEEVLELAIQAHQSSLEHSNPENLELIASRTNNLANALADRYAQSKSRIDIDRAIELTRKSLSQMPPQSPLKTMHLRNLGVNLVELGSAQRDEYVLNSALDYFREGLSLARENRDEDEEILLLRYIANNLLILDSLQGRHDRIDEAIKTLEQAYDKSWASNKIVAEVTIRLAEREETIKIVRLLTGALLYRASLCGNRAEQDLTRAFILGEASKSALLISEIMRRSLSAPNSIPQNMILAEGMWLARLAGLDSIHLRADPQTSLARKQQQLKERADLVSALEEVWKKIEDTGHEGRSYVNLRKSPQEAIVQLLNKSRGETACLSFLETIFPDATGQNQRRLAIMALWPSSKIPQLLSWLPNDPLSDVVTQLALGIQEYQVSDTWFESIITHLSTDIPEVLRRVVVSPTRQGQNIPWHLIIQRDGWLSPEKRPLSVILVPGLAMLLFDEDSDLLWQNIINPGQYFGVEGFDDVDQDAIQVLLRMSSHASTSPLVVGNPSLDLPDAEGEATRVGNILNVRPLVGETATIAAVRTALSDANVIHLAAHAVFDASSPLDSHIKLSDGELSVRELLGGGSIAKLVVLSACESGRGGSLAGSELMSLVTVLLRAGVRSVVASLWSVDDAATAFLMTHFYTTLQTKFDVPEALASAMQIVCNQPGWDDPYYWAGFVTFQRGMSD